MAASSNNRKQLNSLALKQAANWQCRSCGRHCRRHDESVDDFATRIGTEVDAIAAHPRRWTLHITKVYRSVVPAESSPRTVVLCGSCHRTYHNYRRWQHRQQQHRQHQERQGQLTISDIRLPLAGLQLSLSEWTAPYEIVNPLPPRRRAKPSRE